MTELLRLPAHYIIVDYQDLFNRIKKGDKNGD